MEYFECSKQHFVSDTQISEQPVTVQSMAIRVQLFHLTELQYTSEHDHESHWQAAANDRVNKRAFIQKAQCSNKKQSQVSGQIFTKYSCSC